MKEIFRTTLRLYADKPEHQAALTLLYQARDEQHIKLTEAIVHAVNGYYGHQREAPCFDEHQKDAIRAIVREELSSSALATLMQAMRQAKPSEPVADDAPDDEDIDTLLDMMGS
ncbi:MAG: hypothetical protein Q4C54_04705 [Clostridia bacterium]|nr:hypothetical protein [Clostridia bacterium]